MPIFWKKGFKPKLILDRISEKRHVNAAVSVSHTGFDAPGDIQVLTSMLKFPDAAERIERAGLVCSALNLVGATLDSATFLKAINQALARELAAPEQNYALVTSISLEAKAFPSQLAVLGAVISPVSQSVRKWSVSRAELLARHRLSTPPTPDFYLPLKVVVKERTPAAAVQKATAALDLIRGFFALRVNHSMQWTFGSSNNSPINRVRMGAAHTLHKPNGDAAIDALWYEPHFQPTSLFVSKDPAALIRALRHDVRSLRRCDFGAKVTGALVRYARAFDEPDPNVAFLKLWSALESLVTPGQADYDLVVRRCSFLFENPDYHQQVLEHLRTYRNASVHAGLEGDDARTNCYLLQEFFRAAVRFYVGNRRHFATLEAANEFLDLPGERSQLEARLKLVRRALRFVTPTKP